MAEVLKCANCGDDLPPRTDRPDDQILRVCDNQACQDLVREKRHLLDGAHCTHGRPHPLSCATCIIEDAQLRFMEPQRPQRTTYYGGTPPSKYVYITAQHRVEPDEHIDSGERFESPDSAKPSLKVQQRPRTSRSSSVEVLIPLPRIDLKSEEDLCPHGGVIVNGLAYCGYCVGGSDGPEGFHIFLMDLYKICDREGRRTYFHRIDKNEMTQHAFQIVMGKLRHILKADNPRAMACKVAANAIKDLKKKAYNWKEWSLSDYHVFEPGEDGEDEQVFNQVLAAEILAMRKNPLYADFNVHEKRPVDITRYVGRPDFDIPGGEALWTPPCYQRLEIALEAAMASLPAPPQDKVPMSVSMMIKRWVGYFPQAGPQTYAEIGEDCYPNTPPHRVKYLIQKGLQAAREYILIHSAMPIREKGTDRSWLEGIDNARLKK